MKNALSKPWIGPALTIVVLIVSLTSVVFAALTYFRQGDRWAAEDARIGPKVLFVLDGGSERHDGWRRGVLQVTNPLDVELQVLKVEIVQPKDQQVTAEYVSADNADRHPILEKAADHLDLGHTMRGHNRQQPDENWGVAFFTKPPRRTGNEIVMRFILRELPYPHREWKPLASAAFP